MECSVECSIDGSIERSIEFSIECSVECSLAAHSRTLVSQTFAGAVALFNQSDISPDEWMDKVASKGGTTHAALTSFKENKIDSHIKKGVQAAFERAKELGKS